MERASQDCGHAHCPRRVKTGGGIMDRPEVCFICGAVGMACLLWFLEVGEQFWERWKRHQQPDNSGKSYDEWE